MKKLLSVIGTITVISSVSSSVISCGSVQKDDLSKLKVNWYDLYNQRYDKTNENLYNNIYLLLDKSSVNSASKDIISDSKIKIIIKDNDKTIEANDKTDIDLTGKYSVQIQVPSDDIIFNSYDKTFKNIDINPIDINDMLSNATFKSDITNNINGSSTIDEAYKSIRTATANYINNLALKTDNSALTFSDIKSDLNFGISLWNNNDFISDNTSSFNKNWTAINFTTGHLDSDHASIYKDIYFITVDAPKTTVFNKTD